MDIFNSYNKVMKKASEAEVRGQYAWKRTRKCMKSLRLSSSLPGIFEVNLISANRLYLFRQYKKK